ncbi:MAG: caspase family protein [Deinococcales bacterium]
MEKLCQKLKIYGLITILGLVLAQSSADPFVGNKVALVIGNNAYIQEGRLYNAVNDAKDVAESLRAIGFEVLEYEDLNFQGMVEAQAAFKRRLRPGGVAFVFYSGHGVEVNGQNYLIPVDMSVNAEDTLPLLSLSLSGLLDGMKSKGSQVNILVIDACRNNPFESGRSGGGGLAEMNARDVGAVGVGDIREPHGTFIAYATSPGKKASDGGGRNSPYSEVLKEKLREGGPIYQVFKEVGDEVYGNTGGEQAPWYSDGIRNDFYLVGGTSRRVNGIVPREGYLRLTSNPVGAGVYVNEGYIGETPIEDYVLAEGSYRLRLRLEGYYDFSGDFGGEDE